MLDDVGRQLAALLADAPAGAPVARPLPEGERPRRVAAVDGSNVTLVESGSHVVGAWRAARVLLDSGHASAPVLRSGVTVVEDPREVDTLRARAEAALAVDTLG